MRKELEISTQFTLFKKKNKKTKLSIDKYEITSSNDDMKDENLQFFGAKMKRKCNFFAKTNANNS